MQIPCYIKSYAAARLLLTTSTDLPQNANSEHYKQKRRLSVHRPEYSLSPESVCVMCVYVCVCACLCALVLGNNCLTTANQSRDCSVYLDRHWTRKLHTLQSESFANSCSTWQTVIRTPAPSLRLRWEPKLSQLAIDPIKDPVPAEEATLQMMSWCIMTKQGKQDTIRPT